VICNPRENGWELIYQQAHALLAAKLATYWKHQERPERWTETLVAIAEHDNGWQEWESGSRLTPAGAPRHFRDTPLEDIIAQAERVVTRAWHRSLWTALLVSRHISWLHEDKRGRSRALDDLLDEQKRQRQEWRRVLKVASAEVEEAYALLRWADTFSLILCMRQIPFGERHIEIGAGPDGTRYELRQREDLSLQVSPWPYTESSFPVSVDTYPVDQLLFKNDEELVTRLHQTLATPLTWQLRR
jgi:hypothetical protein